MEWTVKSWSLLYFSESWMISANWGKIHHVWRSGLLWLQLGLCLERRLHQIGRTTMIFGPQPTYQVNSVATQRKIKCSKWLILSLTDRRGGYDFSTSNSPLASILGQEKYRRVSRIAYHARTVPPGERCFFVLLLLVTLIYAIGILTALVLLCFHMWFFWNTKPAWGKQAQGTKIRRHSIF